MFSRRISFCHLLGTVAVEQVLKSDKTYSFHFILSFKIILAIVRDFPFPYKFWNKFVYVYQKPCWDVDSNCV